MNTILRNNIGYQYESFWRKDKNDDIRDSNGNLFPYPEEDDKEWIDKKQFKDKLVRTENYLKDNGKFNKNSYNNKDCLLCKKKDITHGTYNLNNTIWEDGLGHYISRHNVIPSNKFIDNINNFDISPRSIRRTIKHESNFYTIGNKKYIKMNRNQILIMDALMEHGGRTRKYIDKETKKTLYRYSEHSGLLDFNDFGLDRVIVSGKTNRVDEGDEDIFLPENIPDAFEYEYFFHTHPPTPKPGGRASQGILYEFPSISDIFHFIDHFNMGKTQGSLVITPEGMYNIRKLVFDRKKIKIDEDALYVSMQDIMSTAQRQAINTYGTKFTIIEFYSVIAQDRKYINMINDELNSFDLHIDFYSRKEDNGKWIIDTVYLPIYIIRSKK